jgi:outer membrane receptor for ferrienterochelin and colicins
LNDHQQLPCMTGLRKVWFIIPISLPFLTTCQQTRHSALDGVLLGAGLSLARLAAPKEFLLKPSIVHYHCAALLVLVTTLFTSDLAAHGGGIEEVVVNAIRTEQSLDDIPLRIEILGAEELREKANMKPGDIRMLLNESTGIQVQQISATSFNSSIRIQGLDGRYTQLLRDGLPIYSGFSGSLSLLQITPLDLAQVEVIKGASSTLFGGGAIAGLVNLVSKKPDETPETAVMINATSASGIDLSAFHSSESGQHGMTLFGTYNRSEAYDPENNGLSAIPEFERFTFTPRWFYAVSDATQLDIGIGLIGEDRLGGSMDFIDDKAPGDYFEVNDSRRAYTRVGLTHAFENGQELTFKNSGSWFDRSLEIPGYEFSGTQLSSFTELTLSNPEDGWVVGINAITENFEQDEVVANFDHDYSERTLGVFGQYSRDLTANLVAEVGLRADLNSDYGTEWLPRISLMLLPLDNLTIRVGGGFGDKPPNLFVSDSDQIQYRNLRPIHPDSFENETSKGINFDINHRMEISDEFSLTSNLLLFYTRIDDPLQVIETAPGSFEFSQSNDAVDTRGSELNLIFGFGEIRYFLGYTYVDARQQTPAGDVDLALVSRHRVNQVLVWEREDDFRIGLEAYYFSSQRRENDSAGEGYWIFGLMTEKRMNESVTAFLNFENFTDARQTKFEDINSGTLQNPNFKDIYAPLDGFVVNGGLRVRW